MSLQYNGSFDIATGRHRKETSWKNKEMQWSELVDKLSVTHRTAESINEYLAAKKTRQDEIKDVGGFVGGYLNGGRRKAHNVAHRQLITLDLDYAHNGLWDDFTMLYDNAAVLYSTHKHTADKPRYRLILPLDREVFSDEYMAIARRIAGMLGIDLFDHTTFQPERLMYWPSTAKDGIYEFHCQDGPWTSADEILNTYRDWHDTSEWPTGDRESSIISKGILKQGDPLEKIGIVGAFCRTYTISEVIELFLSDVYEPTDFEDRYTYKEGSTAAGLVVYEDKYAYSHHGTDPTSGKLCNAFDLVRLHKFGLKDEDARAETPNTKLPSYVAMQDFATSDPKVIKQRSVELIQNAQSDFSEVVQESGEEAAEENDEWLAQLSIDKKGNFLSTIDNIVLILKNDPRLKNRLVLNEFEGRLYIKKDLPWRKITPQTRDFSDDDADCLAHYLESKKMPFTYVQKALAMIRTEFRFHPIRDYLNALKWDGVERVDNLFIDYLGAEESEYTKAVARKTLVAAVARVFNPGIKFDTVLTFIGKEGIGKSTLIARLARQWFSDCLGDVHTKEGMESLRGVWIMEIAEMASFRKADQEAIKRFISSPEDVYRPAYGRQLVRFPRQCIFFATTNKHDFLNSQQGNRRFWPVDTHIQQPVKEAYTDMTDYEVNQVWAEVMLHYKKGESLILPEALRQTANDIRDVHTEMDDRQGLVEKYLNMLLPEKWEEMNIYDRRSFINGDDELMSEGKIERTKVCVAEIYCEILGGMQKDLTQNNTKYVHDMMKKMKGWEAAKTSKRFSIYGTQRAYLKVKNSVNTNVNTKKSVVNSVNTNVNTFL
jgi:putative DNA primase/helicase